MIETVLMANKVCAIDLAALKTKTEAFYAKNPELRNLPSDCRGLSLADM